MGFRSLRPSPLWWGSTGPILFAHGLAQRTFVYSMAAATALAAFAVWGLVATV